MSQLSNQDIIAFNNDYVLAKRLSGSFQNQVVNAIKKFFLVVENRRMDIEAIHRPRTEKTLPKVLSLDEVSGILNALDNIKHTSMFALIYSAGLRRGEILTMKINAVDSKRMMIHIFNAKGKTRQAAISEITINARTSAQTVGIRALFAIETLCGEYD